MTENTDETTAVMPQVDAPTPVEQPPAAAPPSAYQATVPAASGWQHTPKVMLVVAAAILGIALLGGSFASGVVVGMHVGGARPGAFAEKGRLGGPGMQQDGFGGPGTQQNGRGQRGMMQRGGRLRGRGGMGQGIPQNPDGSQVPTAPGFPGGRW